MEDRETGRGIVFASVGEKCKVAKNLKSPSSLTMGKMVSLEVEPMWVLSYGAYGNSEGNIW